VSEGRIEICTLLPAGFRRSDDISSYVGDVFIGKAAAEGRHGILSVRHLLDDGRLEETAGEELLDGLLLEGMIRHDGVLTYIQNKSYIHEIMNAYDSGHICIY